MDKSKLKFRGTVALGIFIPDDNRAFKEFEGKECYGQVTKITKHKDKTMPQLGYYFGYILPVLMDYFGYSKSEMHEAVKYQVLIVEQGIYQKLPHAPSIKNYSTVQFEDYMRNIRKWAMDKYEIFLNLPNEVGFDFQL